MNDLIKRLRVSAKAFRETTVYDGEDTPLILTEQADECDAAADRITAMKAAGDGLGRFLSHTSVCGYHDDDACTCGLAAEYAKWKEASDGL
jgi:hypothetical protein